MSNLDDFFKKRDKKKKVTTKSKFSTIDPEELAKNLEASTINVKTDEAVDATELVKDTERVEKTTDNLDGDGEWKPFDSDENKDYTGLRINTHTWQEEDVENEQTNVTDENALKASCPWGSKGKKRNSENDVENDEEEEEEEEKDESDKNEPAPEPKTIAAVLAENTTASNVAPEVKTEPVAAPTPGAYIPPSMRARMAAEAAPKAPAPAPVTSASSGSSGAYVPPSMRGRTAESTGAGYEIPTSSVNYRRPNKAQPNFNDCLEFPSLDATADNTSEKAVNGDEKFEYAKKSGRVEPKSEKDRQINLQNKFATLSGNQ